MSSPLWKISAAAACMLAAFGLNAHVASAQECGDADNSGSVTVTDGVQALRAAAGLSSTCGTQCDVDGSGSVTVTDGVNILRKAAGIAITEACGGLNSQVQNLLQNTLPIFGALTKGAGAQAAGTQSLCENPDGTVTYDPELDEIEFTDCVIGGISFDGFLDGVSTNTLSFDIDFTVVDTQQAFSFFGDLTETPSGQNSILTGALDVNFDDLGDLNVTFENVLSDPNGNFVDGSLLFDASGADIANVDAVRVGFVRTGTIVPVAVILTDQSTVNFTFDTNSGVLTPAS
jgi:hypothetical protein